MALTAAAKKTCKVLIGTAAQFNRFAPYGIAFPVHKEHGDELVKIRLILPSDVTKKDAARHIVVGVTTPETKGDEVRHAITWGDNVRDIFKLLEEANVHFQILYPAQCDPQLSLFALGDAWDHIRFTALLSSLLEKYQEKNEREELQEIYHKHILALCLTAYDIRKY